MELVEVLGTTASTVAILSQLVGLQICFQIVRKGGTDLTSPVPFLTFFVSACLWLKYGILKANSKLLFTNACGASLQLMYLFVFYFFTSKKTHFHRLLVVTVILLFSPLLYLRFVQHDVLLATRHLGLFCCFMTVCCYASPLAAVRDICRTKKTESMSFLLVLFNFVCAVAWFAYGLSLSDVFVAMPNFLGLLFGIVQLSLFCIYPSVRHRQKTVKPVLLV